MRTEQKSKNFLDIYHWRTVSLLLLAFLPLPLFAQSNPKGIFVVAPAKHEISLSAGENIIRNISITNNLGYDADFKVAVEDISGSSNQDEAVKYYGAGSGPYSIKSYVMVESGHISVPDGETRAVPVMISLPAGTAPGGLYGAIFVSVVGEPKNVGTNVSTRAGSLIFLRIKGEVNEQGALKHFSLAGGRRILWTRSPADFLVEFENTGNIYLNPYGVIEIKNWRGELIDRLPIDPWYVFPDSSRNRLLAWKKFPLFGFFTATLVLNHGYTEAHATAQSYKFFIIPLPFIIGLLALALLGLIVYKVIRGFKKWQI